MGAIFGFTGPPDPALADRMADVLRHRGRRKAILHSEPLGTLGYHAIFEDALLAKLGAGLHHDGDQTIALAGQLLHDDRPPDLVGLLAGYRSKGIRFVEDLRGSFVLAIRDGPTLHLARDGAGARALYYGLHDGRLLFAIEPKGVLAAPGFPRRLRRAAVAEYLTFSFVPGAATMLEGLFELPPGHTLSYDGRGEPVLHRYFVFEDAPEDDGTAEEHWVTRFRRVFGDAVKKRLPDGEPVGLFLSGGIDSSVVAAEVARRHRHPVKTYAIHFGKRYAHELDFARAVADRCGTEHEEVLVEPKQFLPRLRQIIWHLDDPIGDPITVPNFELSARVARDVRWTFNGEGGDPCFGGPKNIPMLLAHWYGGVERGGDFRERAYLASFRRCYDDLKLLLTREYQEAIDLEVHLASILRPLLSIDRPGRFLDKLAAINIRLKGAHLILPKVERMTGAWGLTPLAPLFDENVIRFSFEMPARLRLAGGVEKIVLKRAYARDLPAEVIARPKSGMRVPVHYWFRGELKRYARKVLDPREIRKQGIFDPQRVRQLLDYNTEEGPGRYGLRLWMLLTFEIWRRIVVEGEAC